MARLLSTALAREAAALAADVLWMASSTSDSMATSDGEVSLYTAALIRSIRAGDPGSYESAQAAARAALAGYAQRVPELRYSGAGPLAFVGRPFTP